MTESFEDVLRERDWFVDRLGEATRRAAAASKTGATDDSQELLSHYVARLEDITRAKDEAIERYDEQIREYARLVSEIERALSADRGPEGEETHGGDNRGGG